MRCTFCATGKGGFARNLAAHEIVDQVLTVQEAFGVRVSNVGAHLQSRSGLWPSSGSKRRPQSMRSHSLRPQPETGGMPALRPAPCRPPVHATSMRRGLTHAKA